MKKSLIVSSLCLLLAAFGCSKEPKTYTLNFYDANEDLFKTVELSENTLYNIEEVPEAISGYAFDGWMLDGEIVSDVTMVSDIDLHALYSPVEYIVSTEEMEQYVKVGETANLCYAITPDGYDDQINFYCSDNEILRMNGDGSCTGLKPGEVSVSIELYNSGISFAVYVLDENGEHGRDMSKEYLNLTNEEFVTLTPNDTHQIKWETNMKDIRIASDHPDIAAVDSKGKVTAQKLGDTIIRVSSADKSRSFMVFIYVDGHKLVANNAETDKIYALNDYVSIYLDYSTYEQGRVTTTNGWAEENVSLIIDEGPEVLEMVHTTGGSSIRVIEPYTGRIKIHFEVNGTKSNSIYLDLTER